MATAQSLSPVWPLGTTLNAAGHIEVGGCDLVELAREVGTPAYIVAEDDLRARARAFRAAFDAQTPGVHLSFATKAFPCTAVLRVLAEEGIGADVASGGELRIALRAGIDPARIILHGNAKSPRELAEALDAGVGTIVIDNADELTALDGLADRPQDVMVRVAPDVRGDTHDHISTGQADTKFGVSLAEAPTVMDRIRSSAHLRLRGVHLHIGSQLLELEPVPPRHRGRRAPRPRGGDQRRRRPRRRLHRRRPSAVAAGVRGGEGGRGPRALRRGRRDPRRAGPRARRDRGGHDLRRAVGQAQRLDVGVRRRRHVRQPAADALRRALRGAARRPAGRLRRAATSHGKHCESSDVIARDVLLDDPRAGDIVVTPVTGAYCYAMSNQYNGVPRAPVVFVRDGEARVVVRRETYDDLLSRDVL